MKGELRNEETYRRRETDWLRRPCVGTDGDDVSVASVSGETTIQAGMQMQFSATVKNYTETDAVTWSVSNNTSADTEIDENGLLTIAEDESGTGYYRQILITATSVEEPSASGSIYVSVDPAYVLRIVDGEYAYIGTTTEFAVYYKGTALPAEDFEWKVESVGSWYPDISSPDTKIENGVLTIGADETAPYVKVTATAEDGTVYELNPSVVQLYSLSPSNASTAPEASQQYAVTNQKTGESLPASSFTWSIEGLYGAVIVSEDTAIDENGLFTKGADETAMYIRITATDKETGTTYSTNNFYYGGYSLTAASVQADTAEAPVPAPAPTNDDPAVSQEVVWTVEGANSADTKVDENGTLTIGIDETAEQLYVTATSAADESKSDTAVVNVTPKEKYYVEVIAGEHGTVTPGSGEYYEGTDVTFTFTPDEGYAVDKVTVDGKEVSLTDGKYTLTVTGTTQIEASFKVNPDAPDTGDYTTAAAAVLLAAIAAAGTALYIIRRRRA